MAESNHDYSISGFSPALDLNRLLDPFAGEPQTTIHETKSSFPRVLLLSLGLSGVLWAAIIGSLFLVA
jgi:hypothetical protein